MKTRDKAVEEIRNWLYGDCIGNLIVYHPPGGDVVGLIEERVVKAREMPADIREHFIALMDGLGIERGEVIRNSNGKPDRVKFTRRIV